MKSSKGFKKTKREFKKAIARALTDLAVKLSKVEPDRESIKGSLALIEDKKENTLAVMEDLELQLDNEKKSEEANKISDEADLLIDRVDQEKSQARSFLAFTGSISWPVITHGTLENESPHGVNNDPNKHLDRIKIPIFNGNKLEFQPWFAAFSTCVDKSSLSPQ